MTKTTLQAVLHEYMLFCEKAGKWPDEEKDLFQNYVRRIRV